MLRDRAAEAYQARKTEASRSRRERVAKQRAYSVREAAAWTSHILGVVTTEADWTLVYWEPGQPLDDMPMERTVEADIEGVRARFLACAYDSLPDEHFHKMQVYIDDLWLPIVSLADLGRWLARDDLAEPVPS